MVNRRCSREFYSPWTDSVFEILESQWWSPLKAGLERRGTCFRTSLNIHIMIDANQHEKIYRKMLFCSKAYQRRKNVPSDRIYRGWNNLRLLLSKIQKESFVIVDYLEFNWKQLFLFTLFRDWNSTKKCYEFKLFIC